MSERNNLSISYDHDHTPLFIAVCLQCAFQR